MENLEKQERLDYLLSKRDYLESTGRLLTLKQSREIVQLRAELVNNKSENGTTHKY